MVDLHPDWVTGFSDGEACFHASLNLASEVRVRAQRYFVIGLRADDGPILDRVAEYFGCGELVSVPGKLNASPQTHFRVRRQSDLKRVSDHFSKYPLLSKKSDDYGLWAETLALLDSLQGVKRWRLKFPSQLKQLQVLCARTSDEKDFRSRPETPFVAPPWWVTGLVDGEGSFTVNMRRRATGAWDFDPRFHVSLRADDAAVLHALSAFFGCGRVGKKAVRAGHHPQLRFVVSKVDDLLEKVAPHFLTHSLQTKKVRDFSLWVQILDHYRSELRGRKGWARTYPDKVSVLKHMCDQLSASREFQRSMEIKQHG